MEGLQSRFATAVRPLNYFLSIIGVYFPFSKADEVKVWLASLWSGFWIFLNLQSSIYTFIKQATAPLENLFLNQQRTDAFLLMEDFNLILFRLSSLFFHTCIHFILVKTIRCTIQEFLSLLELIDARLNRPNISSIRMLSVLSLAWIMFTVSSLNTFVNLIQSSLFVYNFH